MRLGINILPPEKKELIRRREGFLLLSAQCVQVSLMTILVAAIVYGIQLALRFEVKNSQLETFKSQEQQVSQEIKAYQDEIVRTNRLTGEVYQMESGHIYWSRLLRKLEDLMPEGTYLSRVGTNEYQVSLAGRVKDRDTLLAFRDRLSGDGCFLDVDVPLSNLFVQEDIDFQIDVMMKPECLKGKKL